MNEYILRVGISKSVYNKLILIFGINHYIAKSDGDDEFSKKLMYFYLYGTGMPYFMKELKELYHIRFQMDVIKFDYITLYPTRQIDGLNKNMINLLNNLSLEIGIPYKPILRRNKTIKASHDLSSFPERVENIKDSVDILEDVKGKNIIIFDNISTTGISLIDIANHLYSNGANEVVGICLGLSSKEKDKDWIDLNKTLKYSRIKDICRTPFVPKYVREKWKKNQIDC